MKKRTLNYFKTLVSKGKHIDEVFIKSPYGSSRINDPLAICIGFNPWKREWFHEYLRDYRIYYIKPTTPAREIIGSLRNITCPFEVYAWGVKGKTSVIRYCHNNDIPLIRVEDGFIRSVGLGANRIKPLSLAFDDLGIYFDSSNESKLEVIYRDIPHKFSEVMECRAKKLVESIVKNNISKYNFPSLDDKLQKESLAKLGVSDNGSKYILAIGQVEDDQSILKGAPEGLDNLVLVKMAFHENPEFEILYRPHPDIWYGKRSNSSLLDEIAKYSTVIPPDIPMKLIWGGVEKVYTITSLLGFEALMHNKEVICLGAPFYSGWGLTTDKYPVARREGELTLPMLVHGALIDYPTYLTGEVEETIDEILEVRDDFYRNIVREKYAFSLYINLSFDGASFDQVSSMAEGRIVNLINANQTAEDAATISKALGGANVIDVSVKDVNLASFQNQEQTNPVNEGDEGRINDQLVSNELLFSANPVSLGLPDEHEQKFRSDLTANLKFFDKYFSDFAGLLSGGELIIMEEILLKGTLLGQMLFMLSRSIGCETQVVFFSEKKNNN